MEWMDALAVVIVSILCLLAGYHMGRIDGFEKGIEIGRRIAKGKYP